MTSWRTHVFTLAVAACLVATAPGCVFVTTRSIWRGWADWNTFGEWSANVERMDHLPLRQPRVETMLWSYGAGPSGQRCWGHCCDEPEPVAECRCQGPGCLFPRVKFRTTHRCACVQDCCVPTPAPAATPGPTPIEPELVPTSASVPATPPVSSAPSPRGAWLFARPSPP